MDVPDTETHSALAEVMLRLQRSGVGYPLLDSCRWMLFDRDLQTGGRFDNCCTGPVVSLGLPWLSSDCSLRWLGPRLFFWPQGIPHQRRVSVVSSRLQQRLDEESWWFDLLRTAILRADSTNEVLCAVAGTAGDRFICRAAELFERKLIRFHVDDGSQILSDDIATWLANTANLENCELSTVNTVAASGEKLAGSKSIDAGTHCSVFVSPAVVVSPGILSKLPMQGPPAEQRSPDCELPVADRVLFAVGDRLQVLRVRPGGAVQALLVQHVQDLERRESLVFLASDAAGQLPVIIPDSQGCVIPWLMKPSEHRFKSGATSSDEVNRKAPGEAFAAADPSVGLAPLTHPEDWLLHWTRPTVGPWPDQDEQDFCDELILGCHSSDRSALATLLRIVSEQRLAASSEAIRGGFRVVSFTEIPLHEFRRRRIYRKHRRRYDFEPWGVAIQRDVLMSAGARPVDYGDEKAWRTTPDVDRPFFQSIGAGDSWSKDEREWRIADDVYLNRLPEAAVAVFVESEAARSIVQKQVHWRVFVVPD